MIIDPITFYHPIFSVFILGIGFLLSVVLYLKSSKKIHTLETEEDNEEGDLQEKSLFILEKSRDKALAIIEKANIKAQEILNQASDASESNKSSFDKRLENVYRKQIEDLKFSSKEIIESYQTLLENAKKDSINIVKNISKNIEISALDEMSDFKEILQKQTLGSQKIVGEKIEQDYEKARQELDRYKKDQLRKFEERFPEVLRKVSQEVIGKALSLSDHEDLVLEALEKAKKELS